MSVTQVLVSRCPSAPLLECGFIKILTLVATNSEGNIIIIDPLSIFKLGAIVE